MSDWITPGLIDWGAKTGITDHWTFSSKCAALGLCPLYQQHIDTFYTTVDFVQMKSMVSPFALRPDSPGSPSILHTSHLALVS